MHESPLLHVLRPDLIIDLISEINLWGALLTLFDVVSQQIYSVEITRQGSPLRKAGKHCTISRAHIEDSTLRQWEQIGLAEHLRRLKVVLPRGRLVRGIGCGPLALYGAALKVMKIDFC